MIDPDFFGCSGKLSFEETRSLATASGRSVGTGDFSEVTSDGRIVTSIDRIHRCAKDWKHFARIALNHAFGDVICASATPMQVMLSFEFGTDVTPAERIECSTAFGHELAERGISLGKCHSSHVSGVTAVTVATLARAQDRPQPNLRKGRIYLSHPIGAFKLHYFAEMGFDDFSKRTAEIAMISKDMDFHRWDWALMTDVSGHGLMGAVLQAAANQGLTIDLELSRAHAMSPEVLAIPVGCLQNSVSSYGSDMTELDERARILLTLRETAGPFVGFAEDASSEADPPGLLLGRYHKGIGEIDISWTE